MLRNLARSTALTAVLVLTVGVCAASGSAAAPVQMRHAAPSRECTVIHADTLNKVEQCGMCLVLLPPSAAVRDDTLSKIGEATPGGAWFAVGGDWFAADKTTSLSGALACQMQLGGHLARYS